MSTYAAGSLPLRRQRLRLAALPCVQPRDPLQWRIFPLVRNAIALAGQDLDSREVSRFVEGNLPPACLANFSKEKLRCLVALVLFRNVRRERLLQRGKRQFALPAAEDATILIPQLTSWQLTTLWVAWSCDMKRPKEVALRCRPAGLPAAGPSQEARLWLRLRPGAGPADHPCGSKQCPGAETVLVRDVKVTFAADGGSGALSADWWDPALQVAWSLSAAPPLPQDAALEVVQQCIQQSAV